MVDVKMTLTGVGGGMGPHVASNACVKFMEVVGVLDANVEVVFDPPGAPDQILEEVTAERRTECS